MSIFSSINNNNDENNNNKPSPPSLGGNPSYSSPTNNNKSNKGKAAIILGVAAIAVVITTVIYYQQISLDREVNEYINFALVTWKATNGDEGYNIIKDMVQTSEFKDKVKTAFSESKTEADRKSNLYKVMTSIMALLR